MHIKICRHRTDRTTIAYLQTILPQKSLQASEILNRYNELHIGPEIFFKSDNYNIYVVPIHRSLQKRSFNQNGV